jgi:hypothetical protein
MKIYLFLPLLFVGIVVHGQGYTPPNYTEYVDPVKALSFKERAYVGVEMSARPWGDQFLELWTTFSYQFSSNLMVGAGPVFTNSDKQYSANNGVNRRLDDAMFGIRAYASHKIINDRLRVRIEYESIYGNELQRDGTFISAWVPALNVGIGAHFKLFKVGGWSFSYVYNVLYDPRNAPFPREWRARLGFNFLTY